MKARLPPLLRIEHLTCHREADQPAPVNSLGGVRGADPSGAFGPQRACRGLKPFARIAITFDTHSGAIANAIALGLTNARLEGMNSTVRLLSHRVRRFRRLESLLAMITLVCGRVPVALPT